MRISQRIRSASLHAFWALLSVVVFGPVLADIAFRDTPAKETLTLLASCYIYYSVHMFIMQGQNPKNRPSITGAKLLSSVPASQSSVNHYGLPHPCLEDPPMLQISQIDHCSVIITDVERSRRFYR